MTKPVQIQRHRFYFSVSPPRASMRPDFTGPYVLFEDHQAALLAALLQARSLLEAKAKEWRDEAQREHDAGNELGKMGSRESAMRVNARSRTRANLADQLLSLAATLGETK